ncbi:MAG: NAD(P)/FAD-dependent oxidoreductase [Candidatus Nitrosopolaris sp.]
MANKINFKEARIQFSFKREVLFIVAGGIMGAIVIAIPFTLPFTGRGSGYAHTWIEFGHIVGVYTPISSAIIAGILIHIVTGISIGIVAGIFLYKTNILNISKPSNGLRYGLFVGALVYLIFSIPVDDFVLNSESQSMLSKNKLHEGIEHNMTASTFSNLQLNRTIYSILNHLIFGIILGLFSSLLSIKLGARYRCPSCDISFSRIDTLQSHLGLVHSDKPINRQKIVILGGGFAGVTVLKRLQSKFQSNISIEIIMVSKDNYLLFTPMLHEVASGTIETRHIVTPIREFCNRSRFYCAIVEDIDLKNKRVMIRPSATIAPSAIMDTNTSMAEQNVLQLDSKDTKSVQYDYLVISLGSETKFFGMADIQKNAFTIKNLNDAIKLRNHIISLLEQSDQLGSNTDTIINSSVGNDNTYKNLQKRLLTFVIVGGGFAGVETAGELNDFVRESAKEYYHNIDVNNIRVIIVQSGDRLLPEMTMELAKFALQRLNKRGVEVILNNRVTGGTSNSVKLKNGDLIPTKTIIWTGGVASYSLLTRISCEHDNKSNRVMVDEYLEIPNYKGVYALGDCAHIMDPSTGSPCPPTAQHAIREGTVAANNIIASIEGRPEDRRKFDYKTRGMMASIGKRTGIGSLFGVEVQGILAWLIWRSYYLAHLPTIQKKLRVLADWTVDMFFKRDVTMLKPLVDENEEL